MAEDELDILDSDDDIDSYIDNFRIRLEKEDITP